MTKNPPRARSGRWDATVAKFRDQFVATRGRDVQAATGKPYGETLLHRLRIAVEANQELKPLAREIVDAHLAGEFKFRRRKVPDQKRARAIAVLVELELLALSSGKGDVSAARAKIADRFDLDASTVGKYHAACEREARRIAKAELGLPASDRRERQEARARNIVNAK